MSWGRYASGRRRRPFLGAGGEIYFQEKVGDKSRLHIIDGSRYQEVAAMDLDGDVVDIKPQGDGRAILLTVTGKGKTGRLLAIRQAIIETTVELTAAPRFIVRVPNATSCSSSARMLSFD